MGALLSAIFLGFVLPTIPSYVGMPEAVLRALAGLALMLALYSLSCYRFADHSQPRWLRLVMGCNLAYCALTAGLVVIHWEQLTALGVAYFVIEMLIIVTLVAVEGRVSRRAGSKLDYSPSKS